MNGERGQRMQKDEKRKTDSAEEAAGHGEPGPRENADPTTQADAGLTGGEHPAGPRQEEQGAGESPPDEAPRNSGSEAPPRPARSEGSESGPAPAAEGSEDEPARDSGDEPTREPETR